MKRIGRIANALAIVSLACSGAAPATKTATYACGARGQLVKVVHTGTVNNNVQTTYTYDKADSRKNVTTTGT